METTFDEKIMFVTTAETGLGVFDISSIDSPQFKYKIFFEDGGANLSQFTR